MIALSVPDGSVRAAIQGQWLAAVRTSPVFAAWRTDRFENLLAVAEVLAAWMDWQTSTTRPTWAEIMRRTGCSRSTVARCIRDLHEAGLAGTVANGRTAGSDPQDPDAGAMAAVYVLAVPHGLHAVADDEQHQAHKQQLDAGDVDQAPAAAAPSPALASADGPVDETDTPSLNPLGSGGSNPLRARETIRNLGSAELIAAGRLWDAGVAPTTKTERFFAAAELRRLDPVIRRARTAAVAAVCREWHLASVPSTTGTDDETLLPGWLISDILYALNHRPDGTPWPHQLTVADVRHVIAWMLYRLDAWRSVPGDRTSGPGLSPTQRRHRTAAAAAAAHAAEVAADQATRAAAVQPEQIKGWDTARAERAARAAAAAHARAAAQPSLTEARQVEVLRPLATVVPLRPAIRPAGPAVRPVQETADPRIAALRAARRQR